MPVLVGIGDDFTGASDQAGMLARAGVRSVLVFDPAFPVVAEDWDAVTYASRLRSLPAPPARRMARALFALARDLRPHMVQYKYCSTFDSTPRGNIGPVLDVATDACQAPGTVVVPALPVNGRTTCHGYHFVLGTPLHESPMKDHPLNPMTDSNLVRWLALQTKCRVGLVSYETVQRGPRAIRDALEALWSGGQPYAVVDCLSRRHARTIARAVWDLPLISGSSALPLELPAVWREQGLLGPPLKAPAPAAHRRRQRQPVLALSGSCAAQTLKQVTAAADFALIRPDLEGLLERGTGRVADQVAAEVRSALRDHDRVLVATSMTPPERAAFQARASASGLDAHQLGLQIEDVLGRLAVWAVVETDLRHLLVAGGETSGAVSAALGLRAVEIVREIALGVPLCRALPERELVVGLKSGNFGQEDFFVRAARMATRY
jgi:uncharacterized protein YgbK (DUF1537 family)